MGKEIHIGDSGERKLRLEVPHGRSVHLPLDSDRWLLPGGVIVFPPLAHSGENAGGRAYLSWDRHQEVFDFSVAPFLPAQLYLRIEDAPDVQALSVRLDWTPNDLLGPCYWLAPGDSGSSCGWTVGVPPAGDFQGDSTHAWTIAFAPGASRECVAFSVGGENCSGRPASFCLISVRTLDSNGEVDELQAVGSATILGGTEDGCPVAVYGVIPRVAISGGTEEFRISGQHFAPGALVSLRNGVLEVPATSVSVIRSNELSARVPIPADFEGATDLIVQSGASSDTLSGQLYAQSLVTGYHPQRIIVWFSPGVVEFPSGASSAAPEAVGFSPGSVQQLLADAGVTSMKMLTPTATVENLAGLDLSQLDMYVCELADTTVCSAIALIQQDSTHVRIAEPDWDIQAAFPPPSDPYFWRQWWLRNTGLWGGRPGHDLGALRGWDITTGGVPTTVYVLDSGIDSGHPEFAGRIVTGYDFISETVGIPEDDERYSHGTSVAGMIGALGNGGGAVAGVNWNVRLAIGKTMNAFGGGNLDDLGQAIDWVRTSGGAIANMSLGTTQFSRGVELIFRNAYMAGVAMFAATGNNNWTARTYPAAFSKFVNAVGAFQHDGRRWEDGTINWSAVCNCPGLSGSPDGSNYGAHLDFLAPGGRLIETTKRRSQGSYWQVPTPGAPTTGNYGFGGTSAAAAAASGAAALIKSHAPQLTNEDLREVLVRSTRPVYPLENTSFHPAVGHGRINVDSALRLVLVPSMIAQGTLYAIADVVQEPVPPREVINWPGIPPGTYAAVRHTVRGTVDLGNTFSSVRAVWPRNISSYGAADEIQIASSFDTGIEPPPWTPTVWVYSQAGTAVTFETYVYQLSKDGLEYYWPVDPTGVYFAYTALGTPLVTAVQEATGGLGSRASLDLRPNPSAGEVEFAVGRPPAGKVAVAVLDLGGREIWRAESEQSSPTTLSFRWDQRARNGERAAAGIYFVTAKVGRERIVRKLVVLK